jgi:hypothetical protein
MLQMFAALVSLLVLAGATGVIAQSVAGDWRLMLRALGLVPAVDLAPLPPVGRPLTFARQIRVVRISPQSAPLRAAI